MKKLYKILIVFGASAVFVYLWVPLFYRDLPQPIEKDISTKFILLWTSPTTEPLRYIVKGKTAFKDRKCPVHNCYVTSNKELLKDLTEFDVILFHYPELVQKKTYHNLPKMRSPEQIYVFASMESSAYYPVPANMFKNYFNMTWTYKLDSDVYFGYITIKNKKGEVIGPGENMKWLEEDKMLPVNETLREKLKKKNKAGAWFVSNCNTPSHRERLINELQTELKAYNLSVDVYGYCGNMKCSKDRKDDCLKSIESEYYFYFSLENSFSVDYVTEKLLTALNNFAVPVVYGGADYNRFMPDGMYLDARNLTRKELAEQIALVMKDEDKYQKYLKWHNHYSYHGVEETPETDPYCNLCDYVNKWNGTKVVEDLEHWWNE